VNEPPKHGTGKPNTSHPLGEGVAMDWHGLFFAVAQFIGLI
jgi:hypothetical protein